MHIFIYLIKNNVHNISRVRKKGSNWKLHTKEGEGNSIGLKEEKGKIFRDYF